jgi:formylmethanofuran dehydrogenase subunit E
MSRIALTIIKYNDQVSTDYGKNWRSIMLYVRCIMHIFHYNVYIIRDNAHANNNKMKQEQCEYCGNEAQLTQRRIANETVFICDKCYEASKLESETD